MTIHVYALDRFTQIGELSTFTLVEAVERDLAVGNWRVVLPTEEAGPVVDSIMRATWLGIEIHDTSTGWRYGGRCTQRRRRYAGNTQPHTIELRGEDSMGYLQSGLDWPNAQDHTEWWQTFAGSGLLSLNTWTLIAGNLRDGGNPLTYRNVTGLIADEPSPHFGPNKDYTSTGLPLIELFRPWFDNTIYTYRIRFDRTGAAGAGQWVTDIRQRDTSPIVVTPDFYTGEIEVIETAASATHVIGMGASTGSTTDPDERVTAESRSAELNWLEAHRERFINRPLSAAPALQEEVTDEQVSSGPTRSVTIDDYPSVEGYGRDVQLGDFVTVNYDKNEPVLAIPISASTLTGTPAGWVRTLSIGAEDVKGPALLAAQISSLRREAVRVETGIHSGGTTTTTPAAGTILSQPWRRDVAYTAPTIPAGTTKYYINSATAQADFDAARNAINAATPGGHQIIFRSDGGTHTGEFRLRGSELVGGGFANLSGTAANKNWITQEPGAQIAGAGATNGGYAIDISAANHWNVVGLNIVAAEGYGIRYMLASGTAGAPNIIHGNTIEGYGSSAGGGIKIRGWFSDVTPGNRGGSNHIEVTGNSVGNSSTAGGAVREFQEGIYVGQFPEWVDTTNNVLIAGNDFYNTGSDLLEIKTGAHTVTIVDNLFHDSALAQGTGGTSIPVGHVTLPYPNSAPTGAGANSNTILARNRFWNLTQAAGAVRPPISASMGGQTVESNIGWGNQFTHLVLIQSNSAAGDLASTGTLTVQGNTDDTAVLSAPDPFGFAPTVSTQANVPDQQAYTFVGPTTGTAEANSEGEGSGFAPASTGQAQTGVGLTDATGATGNPFAGALFEDQR